MPIADIDIAGIGGRLPDVVAATRGTGERTIRQIGPDAKVQVWESRMRLEYGRGGKGRGGTSGGQGQRYGPGKDDDLVGECV